MKPVLLQNLKRQLEKHNKTRLSDKEFNQVLIKIARGNIFEKAKSICATKWTTPKMMVRSVISN